MHKVEFTFHGHAPLLARSTFRYAMLQRLHEAITRRDLTLAAFAFGPARLRLLIEGDEAIIADAARAVKSGTLRSHRAKEVDLCAIGLTVLAVDALRDALSWCHDACEVPPLRSPWTSARDLAGLRDAAFFDAVRARRTLGMPQPSPPHAPDPCEDEVVCTRSLTDLLRIAGAVLGLPAHDPRCFPLFSQLARDVGVTVDQNARALAVTPRRVYQLRQHPAPLLAVARLHLHDTRLAVVP